MNHIYGFNALRAFSAGLVIISHVGIIGAAEHPIWQKFFSVFNATYGVKTFFVLSGFLITTLLIKEYRSNGRIDIMAFLARRALRILPLYFLILLLAAVLILAGIAQTSWTAMVFGALMVYNYTPKVADVNYLSHLWSLGVEEQFYLMWPLVLGIFITRKAILYALCFLVIAACFPVFWRLYSYFNDQFVVYFWTIPAIFPIIVGAVAALVLDDCKIILSKSYVLIISSLVAVSPLYIPKNGVALEVLSPFGIAGMIAWIYLNQSNGLVRRMDCGPIGYAGMISYGLYMWQGFLTGNGPYRVPGFETFPLDVHMGALLTIPAAILSFHLFEQPISNMRNRFRPKAVSGLADHPA